MYDRFTRFILAGLAAGVVSGVLTLVLAGLDISRASLVQAGASIFMDPWSPETAGFWLVGLASHFAFSALYGLAYLAIRSVFGDDCPLAKALALGFIAWLAAGVFSRWLAIEPAVFTDTATTLANLAGHLVYGAALAGSSFVLERNAAKR